MVAGHSDGELCVRGHRPGAGLINDGLSGLWRRGRDLLVRLKIDRLEATNQLVSSFSYLFGGFGDRLTDSGVFVMVYCELSMHGDQSVAGRTFTYFR
ncbi:hypothetical protein BST14_19515 [Mycobacterium arosiense ATCC BAA-1401 = DSM 45069]|uniref:Uncharacterized protein n=1 Tax=Mycobacterium arosiense ATCC BAA-1401 = DSM 45069 TaxID=1265311 RepID=A0A1W9ZBB0_MYCAI|nr:hypothetical protein BST14_19515 [Mycobacterium arosiense ATCC BAA-1401 = DSM 45069]